MRLSPQAYIAVQEAFAGGATHANPYTVGLALIGVGSNDLTSAYPSKQCLEYFPMSTPKLVTPPPDEAELVNYTEKFCCVIRAAFTNLNAKIFWENPLSSSKCYPEVYVQRTARINNGRIVSCHYLETTITELDYHTLLDFYTWDRMDILELWIYRRGYMPTPFIRGVLDLYEKKTVLKGDKEHALEYMISKNMLNACYGMTVTNIIRPILTYDNNMGFLVPEAPNLVDEIEKYNKKYNRFLYYPWGVWVTAHVRRTLYRTILAVGADYVYSDTDSVKCLNQEAHKKVFERYNDFIMEAIQKAVDRTRIPYEKFSPTNAKGRSFPIGQWEFEGTYDRFKTLGRKRYLVDESGKLAITVAGLNKGAVKYINRDGNAFEEFRDGMEIPAEYAKRNILVPIDVEKTFKGRDYLGNYFEITPKSGAHISPSDYKMSLSEDFRRYLTMLNMDMEY